VPVGNCESDGGDGIMPSPLYFQTVTCQAVATASNKTRRLHYSMIKDLNSEPGKNWFNRGTTMPISI
jgi:hypothetical protein